MTSNTAPPAGRRIVVGVEGSGGARAALRFALQEAKYRDACVDVVTAYLSTYVPVAAEVGFTPLDPIDLVGEVSKMQTEIVASVAGELPVGDDPIVVDGVSVHRRLLKGRAAETLIAASEGAEMLVVGNRGRGGFRGLLLGSVSHQIAQHASCPVTIVRAELLPHEQDG